MLDLPTDLPADLPPGAARPEARTPIRLGGNEKITIDLGHVDLSRVDLGHIDLLVAEGVYADRSDVIRNQIERHAEVTPRSVARRSVGLGLRRLDIRVLGPACIAPDVTPDLARAAIASRDVLGGLQASPAVRAALADRPG